MSKIMAVNAGSSSLKFQLFEMPNEKVIASGVVERIGNEDAYFTIKFNGEKIKKVLSIKDHAVAVSLVLEALIDYKILNNLNEIDGVGHRIVHGGELFSTSTKMDRNKVDRLRTISDLAPLHNPAHLIGYEAFKKALKNVEHVFVFDTAFHSTMEEAEFLYALPYEYYKKYAIRKYGFHGTSHFYVSNLVIEKLNLKKSKLITCHIGNGASLAAVKDGKCIATSMGFTPLSGVMMGTRTGDIDPAVVTYLMEKTNKSAVEVLNIFNKKSGLLGISEYSNDSRDIEEAIMKGDKQAILAYDKFINTVVERIGSYFVKLGGCDAIIFTAGIGENSSMFRSLVVEGIKEAFGVELDEEKNKLRSKFEIISTPASKIQLIVVATNEELVIARDTQKILGL